MLRACLADVCMSDKELTRRGGRVAEGAPLLRAYRFTPIEGSNPSLSAINKKTRLLPGFFVYAFEGFINIPNDWSGRG